VVVCRSTDGNEDHDDESVNNYPTSSHIARRYRLGGSASFRHSDAMATDEQVIAWKEVRGRGIKGESHVAIKLLSEQRFAYFYTLRVWPGVADSALERHRPFDSPM